VVSRALRRGKSRKAIPFIGVERDADAPRYRADLNVSGIYMPAVTAFGISAAGEFDPPI
jgi:hypothetical protein